MWLFWSQRIVVIREKIMFPLNFSRAVNTNPFKTDQFVKYNMEVRGGSSVTLIKITAP